MVSSPIFAIIPFLAFLLHIASAAWEVAVGCESPCNDTTKDAIIPGTRLNLRSTGIPDNVQNYTVFLEWGLPDTYRDNMQILALSQPVAADHTASINVPIPPNAPAGDYYFLKLTSAHDYSTKTFVGPLSIGKRAPVYVPPRQENFTVQLGCYATKCHDNNTIYIGETVMAKWTKPSEGSPNAKRFQFHLCWGLEELVQDLWGGCLSLSGGIKVTGDSSIDLAPSGVNVTFEERIAPGSSYYFKVSYFDGSERGPSASVGPFTIASSS